MIIGPRLIVEVDCETVDCETLVQIHKNLSKENQQRNKIKNLSKENQQSKDKIKQKHPY
jgi:hypothetical protein